MDHAELTPPPAAAPVDLVDLTDGGERVTHLAPNDCYYAHLSIYAFAVPFARGSLVLDAGCGTGYGSHYLAANGARHVTAVDASAKAVAFCRRTFVRDNLDYRVLDLETVRKLPGGPYDLIFSSNVLEHLADVRPFFRAAWAALKPTGTLLIAVPPITSDYLRDANLSNLYHLNIWTPPQWHHVLAMYFDEVCYHGHWTQPGVTVNFEAPPDRSVVTEHDFVFPAVPLDRIRTHETLTSVFVVRKPVPARRLPRSRARLTFVDDSFTRRSPLVDLRKQQEAAQRPLTLPQRVWYVARHLGPREFAVRTVRFTAKRLARLAGR
jgi:SAM-dependent methyltransferase